MEDRVFVFCIFSLLLLLVVFPYGHSATQDRVGDNWENINEHWSGDITDHDENNNGVLDESETGIVFSGNYGVAYFVTFCVMILLGIIEKIK